MRRWLLAVALRAVQPRRRVGAGLSEPADHRGGAVPGRRADRRHHPQSRRTDARLARPAAGGRIRTGAGGTVGTARVARAAPDGYTIICGHFGTHVTNGAVYSLPYDLVKDFAPISLLPSNPYLIVVNKDLPVNNLREFLAYLKANPDKVNMGHPGVGTGPHLLAVLLAERSPAAA